MLGVVPTDGAPVTDLRMTKIRRASGHRLFAVSLQPGRLTVVDTQSGRVVATLPCILGVSGF